MNLPAVFAANPVTAPDVSSLIYLADLVSEGPDVYEDAGMTLAALFGHLLPRYAPPSNAVILNSPMPFGVDTGSVSITGTVGAGATDGVAIGNAVRNVFGPGVALGSLSEANGPGCIVIGRSLATPNFAERWLLMGAATPSGFADTHGNISISDVFTGNCDDVFAGIGTKDFSDLTEAGSLALGGELRTQAPVSGAAGNWRFGSFAGGMLRVTVDGVDYEWAAAAA